MLVVGDRAVNTTRWLIPSRRQENGLSQQRRCNNTFCLHEQNKVFPFVSNRTAKWGVVLGVTGDAGGMWGLGPDSPFCIFSANT